MRTLSSTEMIYQTVEALGLDSNLQDLTSVEVIANALRRAAGFLCPCAGKTLVRAVIEPLEGLYEENAIRATVEETLEALIAYGDLLELHEATQEATGGVLLFAAPPSFVRRRCGAVMILGIAPDGVSVLSEELEVAVEHRNYVRLLKQDVTAKLTDHLHELGFIELSLEMWMKCPKRESADEHIEWVRKMIAGASPSGSVAGLMLVDPGTSVRYYRGRWTEPNHQTGFFVARRPQAYGPALWCYVEVDDGRPVRLLDFPLREIGARGCDDAWRLQAAIDYKRGVPQMFHRRGGPGGTHILGFYSPIPMWARRRLAAIGDPINVPRYLFAYKFPEKEIDEELSFIREYLWLVETT